MPFLRHARDKRGYETTFVMHTYRPGSGQAAGRTRLLYMFRTPSTRKVGRNLLDPEVMEALEHTHPDLTFDWQGMLRAPAQISAEPERERERGGRQKSDRSDRSERHERGERHGRQGRGGSESAARQEPAPAAETLSVLVDESLLGRTAGALEAARMRTAFNELMQRIARRARTPEERERLIERAGRLNPDEWSEAATITSGMASFAEDCEAIRQELPRRRRGRRGGRTREREPGSSATMGSDNHDDAHELEMVDETGADDRSLDDGVGAGHAGAPDDASLHDVD